MRLAPDVFWRYTLRDWHDAIEGYLQSKGGGTVEAMNRDELEELMEQYPDG